MENFKGEVTITQVVSFLLILASFAVIVLFIYTWKPWENAKDETCHNSVVLRSNSILTKIDSTTGGVKDSIPLNCETEYLCITKDGTCESMTSPTIKKVSTSEQIYEILAEEMADCWWMYGEGRLAYASSTTSSYLVCSICDQVGFDNSINFVQGNYISKLDFYNYLSTTKMSNDEDAQTYSEYLFGLNKEELTQSDKTVYTTSKVVREIRLELSDLNLELKSPGFPSYPVPKTRGYYYIPTDLKSFYQLLDYNLLSPSLIKPNFFPEGEISYLDYFLKLKELKLTSSSSFYLLKSDGIIPEEEITSQEKSLQKFYFENINLKINNDPNSKTYLDYLTEARANDKNEIAQRQLEKIGGINLSKQHLIVTGIITSQSLAGEIGSGIWQGLKLGAIAGGLAVISGGTFPIAAIVFGATGSTYALVGSFLIKGDSGDPYLTPTIIEANSKELSSLKCEYINTLA